MLVLTRYSTWSGAANGQDAVRVVLPGGETMMVHVIKNEGDKVSLGFDGPKNVRIWREEVWRRQATNDGG